MGVQAIDTDMTGPLNRGTVGLVLGCSSSPMRGLFVLPGVIDPDYTGIIKVLCHAPFGVISIAPGDRIAQLLVLPSCHDNFQAKSQVRRNNGLGSSGLDLACLSVQLDDRPILQLEIEGKTFSGLLDTGADRSVMREQDWPKQWPLQTSTHTLQGLGYEQAPAMSAKELTWRTDDQKGIFQPFVVKLPINLWGRDVQKQMRLMLTNEYSNASQKMMRDQGFVPGKGLGARLQGKPEPVQVQLKRDRKGLGFS